VSKNSYPRAFDLRAPQRWFHWAAGLRMAKEKAVKIAASTGQG
jgi:hypothetical protein